MVAEMGGWDDVMWLGVPLLLLLSLLPFDVGGMGQLLLVKTLRS